MHLDSMASTVLQTCAYWGNSDQCAFCGIGVTLADGRTIAKKTPEMLAEVSVAARDLDGAVDATLTTGSTATPDRGALYVGTLRPRGQGGLGPARPGPVRAACRPRRHRPRARPRHRLGRHPRRDFRPGRCWRGSRPARPAPGIDAYFAAWERAVEAFGEGQVSTYVILGMGEDPRADRRGLQARGRPGRLPVRCAAAAGPGQPDAGPAAAVARTMSRASTARSSPTCWRGASVRPGSWRVAPVVRPAPRWARWSAPQP